jgi:hypothetical protein
MNKEFNQVFDRREWHALTGKKRFNLWLLGSLLILVFLALGFANGSIQYLHAKMNDPFVNWVEIRVSLWQQRDVSKILEKYNDKDLQSQYGYFRMSGHVEYPVMVLDPLRKTYFKARGRTLAGNDPLSEAIFSESNLISGRSFEGSKDHGIVVTERFLREFHYPEGSSHVQVYINLPLLEDSGYVYAPVPIIAIVKELPGRHSLAFTMAFCEAMRERVYCPYDVRQYQNLIGFVPGDSSKINVLQPKLEQALLGFSSFNPSVTVIPNRSSHQDGWDFRIDFGANQLSQLQLDSIWKDLFTNAVFEVVPQEIVRLYDYDYSKVTRDNNIAYDAISIHFFDLDKVRVFNQILYTEEGLEMDLTQIKEKENFNFLSKSGNIIAWLLVVISALGIILYLHGLIRSHLSQIKMNLGTFLAFGMQHRELKWIYLRLIVRFMLTATAIAIPVSAGIGLGLDQFFRQLMKTEPEISYYSLMEYSTLFVVLILLAAGIGSGALSCREILNQSPGDLVYGRSASTRHRLHGKLTV